MTVVTTLLRDAPEGMTAGELAAAAESPANTMSAHLTILTHAGLVASERRGRSVLYRAEVDAISELISFIVDELGGRRQDLLQAMDSLLHR